MWLHCITYECSVQYSSAHLLSFLQCLQEIVSRGADPANIRVVAVVAAPPALKLMADAYPGETAVLHRFAYTQHAILCFPAYKHTVCTAFCALVIDDGNALLDH